MKLLPDADVEHDALLQQWLVSSKNADVGLPDPGEDGGVLSSGLRFAAHPVGSVYSSEMQFKQTYVHSKSKKYKRDPFDAQIKIAYR